MHELTGKIANVSFSFEGKPLVTLEMNERNSALAMLDDLRDEDKLAIKIGKYKTKRSLDANAYCWVLIGKIAEKTGVARYFIYRDAIRNIGGNYDVVCIQNKAVETLCEAWSRNGIGWLTETMPSKIDGCTNVLLFYGSSTYDVQQMSRLIDNILQECYSLDIEVKSQSEIDSLLNSWGGKK